jgi:NADH:ubiquinone reductase (non-electrogenic)
LIQQKKKKTDSKKRLVILGSGWASVSVLRNLDRDKYEITVVSPRNYFLFTPLLPSVSVGTISNEAVTVPMREFTSYKTLPITKRLAFLWRGYLPPRCQYVYAGASDVDPAKKIVTCQHPRDKKATFPLEYEELIICTGATTNTFNTEGVDEYCHYLKETGDATLIRQAVLHNLERASLPHVLKEEQKRLLSFLVVGGGPTGVEVAAELQDFLVHDVVNPTHSQYHRLNGMTSITLVQSNKNRKSVLVLILDVCVVCLLQYFLTYTLLFRIRSSSWLSQQDPNL